MGIWKRLSKKMVAKLNALLKPVELLVLALK